MPARVVVASGKSSLVRRPTLRITSPGSSPPDRWMHGPRAMCQWCVTNVRLLALKNVSRAWTRSDCDRLHVSPLTILGWTPLLDVFDRSDPRPALLPSAQVREAGRCGSSGANVLMAVSGEFLLANFAENKVLSISSASVGVRCRVSSAIN